MNKHNQITDFLSQNTDGFYAFRFLDKLICCPNWKLKSLTDYCQKNNIKYEIQKVLYFEYIGLNKEKQ